MAVFLASDPINSTQFQPGGNTPASGALLFCYQNKTSTKMNSYSDPSASTANTNPIVLNSGGNPPQEIWIASTATFVLAPSNDTDPPASPYRTWNDIPGINNVAALIASSATGEWVQGSTVTFVGVTAFSLVGDQTALYTLGRRIKAAVTGGDRFGIVTSSVLTGASTAVGVTLDSSTLNGGLSSIQYGLLSTPNGSVPWIVETSTGINLIGSTSAYAALTFISVAHNDALTTVTSSANPNIWTGGNVINFTGTTAVSSFANAPQAGASRTLLIAGATSVTFATSAVLTIGGGTSTYIASIGEKLDVIATSTNIFTIYPAQNVVNGQWTPSVTFAGASTGITLGASNKGVYQKTGKKISASFRLQLSNIGSASGSPIRIINLPYPVSGTFNGAEGSGMVNNWVNIAVGLYNIVLTPEIGVSSCQLACVSSASASLIGANNTYFSNSTEVWGALEYFTDS